jgi:hypothetical protein
MVDPAEEVWGGSAAAESRHYYRFRTRLVYLARHVVQIKKSSTHEQVKLAATEPWGRY